MIPRSPATHILVADDAPDLRDILRSILEPAGFSIDEAEDGAQVLARLHERTPDLMILDYMMPRLSGPELCAQIKDDMLLRHIPILMLTGKSEVQDKVRGIAAGADDYLVKPFEPQELLARVQMALRRTAMDLEANPLTKLPGNISIQRELERRLAGGASLAVCYLDLNRFKAFNDHYGFQRGDEVIRQTAAVLLEACRESGTPQDFIGHIGGDDFVIITMEERGDAVCRTVVRRFDALVASWYDEEDRRRGYLLHTDRRGQLVKQPLLSIAIALLTTAAGPLTSPAQVAKVGAELKAYAKQFEQSVYVKERRQGP